MSRFTLLGFCCLLTGLSAQAGLIQNLDGSLNAFVQTNASGVVTNWVDQSGSGNAAVPAVGAVTYSATNPLNGLKALNFGPSRSSLQLFSSAASAAWLNQSGGTNGFCVLVAFHLNTLTNPADVLGNISGSTPSNGFSLRFESSGQMKANVGGNIIAKSGSYVVAGDTLVYALNYNAVSGQMQFWDSKNQATQLGNAAAADFSLGNAVTLGSTASGSSYLNGEVGAVQVYGQALSATNFKQAHDQMTLKWTGVTPIVMNWRVMTNTGYPTDDAVVYAVSISDPGVQYLMPTNPATGDCTAAFQAALNSVAGAGGGTVFVPAGKYLFTGNLTIPNNVILRGAWQPLTNNAPGPVGGTILMPTGGAGQSGGTPFITIGQAESGLKDFSIWYPNQSAANIVPYPPAIGNTNNNGASGSTAANFMQNLNLVNAYDGIILTNGASSLACVRNIYGSPLHEGLNQLGAHEVPRYENINFSPDYWAFSGLSNAPASGGPQATYIYTNGTAIYVSASDQFFGAGWNIRGYWQGLYCDYTAIAGGTLDGDFYGLNFTNCQTDIYASSIGSDTYFMNCSFDATSDNFYIANHITGVSPPNVFFDQCNFTGGGSAYAFDYGYAGNLPSNFSFQGCKFTRPFNFASSPVELSVVNCQFSCPSTAVTLGSKAVSGIFLGNSFAYSPGVATNAAMAAAVVIDNRAVTCSVPPTFNLTNYNHWRQPAQLIMKVMGVDYPVNGDGLTDDSTNVQTALNDVGAAGGGIVFLPVALNGYALYHQLFVPAGVELRGVMESMPNYYTYNSNPGDGTLLQIYYGAGSNLPPCINLTKGSGLKGFVFHYPQQFATNIVPYAPAVGGTGTNIYVQYCVNLNAYQFLQLSNADNHLVEYCFLDPVNTPITVLNSSNGRIQNLTMKDNWGQAGLPTATNYYFPLAYYLAYGTGWNLVNCTNQTIALTWNRLVHQVARVESSSVLALMWNGESNYRWLKAINPLPAGVQILEISMRVNANGGFQDESYADQLAGGLIGSTPPPNSLAMNGYTNNVIALDVSGNGSSGPVQVFGGMLTGFPDWLLTLSNANCTVQQCDFKLDEATVPSRGIYLNGNLPSVCRLDNMTFTTYTPFYATNVAYSRIELAGCGFFEGGQFDAYSNSTVGSLSAGYITSGTRIATMATLSPVAAAVGLNTDPQFPADANVLTNVANQSHILTNAINGGPQLPIYLNGWMPYKVGTNAMFLDVDVTSAWMTNSAVTNVQILVNYYDSGTGGIKVYYDSRTNGFTLAGTITLNNSNTWINATILLPIPAFSNRCRGADISLSFPDTSATILSFVKVMTVQSQLMNGTTNVINATALFTGTPTNGARPLTVTFTDQSTGSITNLLWNFGDGQTTNTTSGAVLAHTYTIAGNYPVTLIASGLGGASTNLKSGYVKVNVPAAPNIGGISLAGLTNLLVTGTGGPTNGLYYYWVRSATNLTLPLTNWSVVATNVFNADGSFSNWLPVTPATSQMFFRLEDE